MKPLNLHIVSHLLCPYVQRSVITLKEKGIPYTRTNIILAEKPEWFTKKSPMGKVPILIVDEQSILFESAVICEYLDEITPNSLHPSDSLEKAKHRAWIEFGSSILGNVAKLFSTKEADDYQNIHHDIKNQFQHIERELTDGPFFSGEKFQLIDAVYAPIFRYFDAFDTFSNLQTFSNFPKCQLWRAALKQRKSVQDAIPKNYQPLLMQYFIERKGYMAELIEQQSLLTTD